jgi:hypothetical protein
MGATAIPICGYRPAEDWRWWQVRIAYDGKDVATS